VVKDGRLDHFPTQNRLRALALVSSFLAASLGPSPVVAAAASSDEETNGRSALERLNSQVESELSRYLGADGWRRVAALEELETIVAARKEWMRYVIQTDPDLAAELALLDFDRRLLPKPLGDSIERLVTLEGRLEIVISDHFEDHTSFEQRFIATENGSYFELLLAADPGALVSGMMVRAQGIALDGQVAVPQRAGTFTVLGQPASRSLGAGPKNIAVILFNFQNDRSKPWNASTVSNVIFNQSNAYHSQNSFGQTTLSGNVFGYYTLPINKTCNTFAVAQAAIAAADPAVNFLNYTNIVFAGPISGCGWTGFATIGPTVNSTGEGAVTVGNLWLATMTAAVVSHELGHNMGLRHANFYDCGLAPIAASCSSIEYGDNFDIMGNHTNMGHTNAGNKELLGIFGPENVLNLSAVGSGGSGTYTLAPIESASTQPQMIRIRRSGSSYLTIEYRQRIGYDTVFSAAVLDGALIHVVAAGQTHVVDMTPSEPNSGSDVTLEAGRTFTDPGIATVTVLSSTASALTLEVQIAPPTVDLKVDGQQGPVVYTAPKSFTVGWTSNAESCEKSGSWSGTAAGTGSENFSQVTTAGTYTFTLDCANSAGTASDSVVVELQEPTEPPTVDIRADQHFGGTTFCQLLSDGPVNLEPPAAVDVCWFASAATQGCTNSGSWSGTGVSGYFTTQTALPAGTYLYEVTCANAVGSAYDSVIVQVSEPPNQPPIAAAGPDQTVYDSNGDGSESATLNGSESYDLDGTIVSYAWWEDDNLLSSSATGAVVLPLGQHLLDLTITDNRGASATDSVLVTVSSAPPQPQTVFFDDFQGGNPFLQWTESNEFDWRSKSATEKAVPGSNGSNQVAHADQCSSSLGCILTKTIAVDLSSYQSAALSFWRYVDNDLDSGEFLKLEAFDGASWNTLLFWTHGQGDDDTWHYETVNLPANYLHSAFSVRFTAKQNSNKEDAEIDDVLIQALP